MYKYHIIIMHAAPWRLLLLSIGNIIYSQCVRRLLQDLARYIIMNMNLIDEETRLSRAPQTIVIAGQYNNNNNIIRQ